ncbi:hypothetical protein [Mycolicibacterium thermoresistibile]
MGYCIDVITDSVQEAVRHAGGFMFDRRRAGWHVVVVTDDAAHSRALAILGVSSQSPGEFADRTLDCEVHTVVTRIGQLEANREPMPTGARREPNAQLLLWANHPGTAPMSIWRPVRHNLSAAARTFKAQALLSTGLSTGVENCEHFWVNSTLDVDRFLDLLPDGLYPADRNARTASRSPTVMGEYARG